VRKTILVVDDNPLFVDLVRDIFAVEEIEVISDSQATAALSTLKIVHPSLIISDFDMPGMNGMEFHSHLLLDHSTKDIPFVFMTGSADHALMQYANRYHVRLLSKNNLVKDLIELLNDLK
jgi:phosphoserine phosphatase RsbU/P